MSQKFTPRLLPYLYCGFAVVIASASSAATTNGAGLTMDVRVTAGGGASVAGANEMVNVIAGPIGPQATNGTGSIAEPFSPTLFALPVTLSQFSID